MYKSTIINPATITLAVIVVALLGYIAYTAYRDTRKRPLDHTRRTPEPRTVRIIHPKVTYLDDYKEDHK